MGGWYCRECGILEPYRDNEPAEDQLSPIIIPESFNYVGAFLTFACQLRCSYCINHHGGNLVKGRKMDGKEWIRGLNRIRARSDLPITLQGGEPSVHKDFTSIVAGIGAYNEVDILTNLEQPREVWEAIDPQRVKRSAKYASIRVSYHHGQSDFDALTRKVSELLAKGYSIGIWEVDHPDYHEEVLERARRARADGIDYRLKEFLGPHKGVNYGTMRYDQAVNSKELRSCECRTSELLIGPDGHIFRCHSDLYANRSPIGHILEPKAPNLGEWKHCAVYGACNSCDIKVKTNRFQEYGHSSVDIRNISKTSKPNHLHVEEVVNTYGKPDTIQPQEQPE
jgi:organic radical activating enzyme